MQTARSAAVERVEPARSQDHFRSCLSGALVPIVLSLFEHAFDYVRKVIHSPGPGADQGSAQPSSESTS